MKKQDKIETVIKFGGFYESIHSAVIDSRIESYYEEGNYPEYHHENIDYKNTNKSYIENYCSELENYILNEYEIHIDFKNISLNSPEFYNYSNDTIFCDIDKKQAKNLIDHFIKNSEFLEYLKNNTKSYSGYISFYTFNQAINNKDNILILYLLDFLSDEFNEKTIVYGDIYFDVYLINDNFNLKRAK
jgi:hypothetical protein